MIIRNGRVIDPANGVDEITDILITGGKIEKVEPDISGSFAVEIDATGKWVTPGLIDIHTHLREPGHEYKETIATGTKSAAKGGFTAIACMANTNPTNDNAETTRYIQEKGRSEGVVRLYVIGAISKNLEGKKLADIGEMAKLGIVAISDDGRCVMDSSLMRSASEYSAMFDLPIIEHAEDHTLNKNGVMNEGVVSEEMGLPGAPDISEDIIVARDRSIAQYLGSHIHIAHISTKGAIETVRQGKKEGIKITAEVAPHHFSLTESACCGYDTNAKMAPPLRRKDDIEAIYEGLRDGTIDAIATDHAPHAVHEKETGFESAAFGIIGLETALPLSLELVREKIINETRLVELMSVNPAKILKLKGGRLSVGDDADITIIDPDVEWEFKKEKIVSRSKNSPFIGWKMKGRADMTIVGGKIVHGAEA